MSSQSKMKEEKNKGIGSKILHIFLTYFRAFGTAAAIYGLGYFKFSISWIFFASIGYVVYKRSIEKRIIVSSALKAIGRDEKKCILESLTTRELPSWVFFPDVERAEWLNKIIKRTWPFISNYVEKILIEKVQPMVNSYIPVNMGEFSFSTIDLGDMPPRIGGVKVYTEDSIRRDEIVMDIDLMLYSDGRIKVLVGKAMAGVKEFELRGTLRVVLKPLVSKIPFAGAVTVYFLDDPNINFFLTHIGNLIAMPGLLETMSETIKSVVNQLMVVPNRISIPLVDEINITNLKYPWPQGVVVVNVISGKNLVSKDISLTGKKYSDPYCEIESRTEKFKTKIIQKTLEPTWNEYFEIIIEEHTTEKIKVNVFDKDQGNKDDFLGTVSISLEPVFHKGKFQKVYILQQVKSGSLKMRFFWLNFSADKDVFKTKNRIKTDPESVLRDHFGKEISQGFLMVCIDSAKNLGLSANEPSPYCSVSLNRTTKNTDPKDKTREPVWEHTMYFLVKDPYHDNLTINVRDSKTSSKLGELDIPISSLLLSPSMELNQPFKLKEAGNEACINLVLKLKGLLPGMGEDHDHEFHDDEDGSDVEMSVDTPSTTGNHHSEVHNHSSKGHGHNHGHDDTQENLVENLMLDRTITQKSPTDPDQEIRSRISPKSLFSMEEDSSINGQIEITSKYSSQLNRLDVTVHQCKNLRGIESDGLSDPYIKIYLMNKDDDHVVNEKKRTKVIKNSLNPIFDEQFSFPVDNDDIDKLELHLDVKNKGSRFGTNEILGSYIMPLTSFDASIGKRTWFSLSIKSRSLQRSEKSSVRNL